MTEHTIWTIGHSTRSRQEFLDLLKTWNIGLLADVRSFPGSRRFPHFNKEPLAKDLPATGIQYLHFPGLGGRRKPVPGSVTTWRNKAFSGYADYMKTPAFAEEIAKLCEIAEEKRTAYMCSEAVWWRCHRSLISDYLKSKGWEVIHILSETQSQVHPYTSPARVVQGNLFYDE